MRERGRVFLPIRRGRSPKPQSLADSVKGTPGRKPKYDWGAIFRLIDENYASDDPPGSFIECARRIIAVFEARHVEPPDEDYLRLQVSTHLRRRSKQRGLRQPGPTRSPLVVSPYWGRYRTALGIGTMTVGLFVCGMAGGWYMAHPAEDAAEAWLGVVSEAVSIHRVHGENVRAKPQNGISSNLPTQVANAVGLPSCMPGSFGKFNPFLLVAAQAGESSRLGVAHAVYRDASGDEMTVYLSRDAPTKESHEFRYLEADRKGVVYWYTEPVAIVVAGNLTDFTRAELMHAAIELSEGISAGRWGQSCFRPPAR